MTRTATALATLLLLAAAPAFAQKTTGTTTASPEVVTIDQAKALAGSVTPNDPAGFPVVITQPGSYRLTGNLVVPAGVNGILVMASDVTIDLNGYAIIGSGTCSGSPLTCTGSAQGIEQHVNNYRRLSIRNGHVRGFHICVDARFQSRVSDIDVGHCYSGVSAFQGTVVSGLSAAHVMTGVVAYGGVVLDANFSFVNTAVSGHSSLVRGINVADAIYGVYRTPSGSAIGVHGSVLQATTPLSGAHSMGNNLCNSTAC